MGFIIEILLNLDDVKQLDDVFLFFKNASSVILQYKHVCSEPDDLRLLMGLIWEMFAGYSVISGEYSKNDLVMEFVKKTMKTTKISKAFLFLAACGLFAVVFSFSYKLLVV